MPQKILFTSIKNEGPFLLEWVAYHRMIGFERVIVFSNDCTDGSVEMLDALAKHGFVEHYQQEIINNEAPQHKAAKTALDAGMFPIGDWVMWLDLDEFLVVNIGNGSLDALRRHLSGVDSIAFNWRVFGGNHQVGLTDRFVSENYVGATQRNSNHNSAVKSLFQMSEKVRNLHLHQPFWIPEVRSSVRIKNGASLMQAESFAHAGRPATSPMARLQVGRGSYRLGQVNHYMVRNRDLYMLKKLRGDGSISSIRTDSRYSDAYFNKYDINEREDRAILRHEASLNAEIEGLEGMADIKAAHENCMVLAQAELDRILGSDQL